MDLHASWAGSPTPLQTVSPERVNQQREPPASLFSATGNGSSQPGLDGSTASVTDKISQFNTLAMQSKQLERKTADAALKRAMLGREEAETEMRRYRDEVRQLRKQLDEGRDRERRVGERLETVMENYGRAKETHAHTQALWEKEIRRARKETFKSQSAIVKLQEELKTARASARTADDALVHEKARSEAREQEAFQARYALVSCQEELDQSRQIIKMLEQERDAFKSLATSKEDVVRIASEGRLPLPPPDADEEAEQEDPAEASEAYNGHTDDESCTENDSDDGNDGLVVPKRRNAKRTSTQKSPRRAASAALRDITSSAASEAEIEELTRLWQWEKQRGDRATELVAFLEAECELRACACMRKRPRSSHLDSARKRPTLDLGGSGLSNSSSRLVASASEMATIAASPTAKLRANLMRAQHAGEQACDPSHHDHEHSSNQPGPRTSTSTVFIPEEGVFRTVSQQIAEEMEEAVAAAAATTTTTTTATTAAAASATFPHATGPVELHMVVAPVEQPNPRDAILPEAHTAGPFDEDEPEDADTTMGDATADTAFTENTTTDIAEPSMYARTPSVDPPPSFAMLAQQRTSLLSLLDAPHRQDAELPSNFHVPTTPAPTPVALRENDPSADVDMDANGDDTDTVPRAAPASILVSSTAAARDADALMEDSTGGHDRLALRKGSGESTPTGVSARNGPGHAAFQADEAASHEDKYENGDAGEVVSPARQNITNSARTTLGASREEDAREDDTDGTPVAAATAGITAAHDPYQRPHTVATLYTTKTTVTKVPLRPETTDPSLAQRILAAQRTPQAKMLPLSSSSSMPRSRNGNGNGHGNGNDSFDSTSGGSNADGPSFDIHNPALTPTMTREQCLAQIRERRGRARSAASGGGVRSRSRNDSGSQDGSSTSCGAPPLSAATSRRPVTPGKERREVSAPVGRVNSVRRVRS
ncbi:hypothetical protein SPI_07232 [Niveomyces insectorum RCEF 264]|uniref:Uncharacterized protein n=1 Tax=Niveomyces insectorum RCEF 264 TaxID=1081102 RepID=A0A167QEP1_9HYPO|nr:hypothetical protein SPI_07232 [Niveomyces insectorum RCEF 264]